MNDCFFQKDYNALVVYREPTPALAEAEQFQKLLDSKWVQPHSYKPITIHTSPPIESMIPDLWIITACGKDQLLAYEEEIRKHTEEEEKAVRDEIKRIQERKQDRRDKWLISIFSACGGSVFTLCIEHFKEITVFFAELFK